MAQLKAAVHTLNERKASSGSARRPSLPSITLPLVNDRSQAARGRGGRDPRQVPPHGQQPARATSSTTEGCEANVPGLVDFFLFGLTSPINMKGELGSKASKSPHAHGGYQAHRDPPASQWTACWRSPRALRAATRTSLSLPTRPSRSSPLCNTMGEGWLLTAEMVDLIEHGTPNIVCCAALRVPAQPRGGQVRDQAPAPDAP